MTVRMIIAGCRNYIEYEEASLFIDQCISEIGKENRIIIISGGSSGADEIGEKYAEKNNFCIERYPADWKTFGKKAGPIRNKRMAEVGDVLICFWDGKSKGTKSIISYVKKYGKPIWIKKI